MPRKYRSTYYQEHRLEILAYARRRRIANGQEIRRPPTADELRERKAAYAKNHMARLKRDAALWRGLMAELQEEHDGSTDTK